jgi:aryl-alcohol dehydrogenase-like predicted oxidoreductase
MPASLKKSIESTKVSYVPLGKSGLKVSIPILGAMSFGSKDWQPWVEDNEEKGDLKQPFLVRGANCLILPVFELLHAAYSNGLNTWDTANVYSAGVSEQLIGKAIKKHNIPRHKLVILTKCFGVVGESPLENHIRFPEMKGSKDYVNQGGLSRAAIFNAVNASLARLQTDYIDLLQIHRFDGTVPVEETMKALHDLVQNGKVRYIGASSMWAFQFQTMQNVAEKHGWTKFVSMQNHYSLCVRVSLFFLS